MNAPCSPHKGGTDEPLYDVLTESGKELARNLTFDAAHQLARKYRDASDCLECSQISVRSVRVRHMSGGDA